MHALAVGHQEALHGLRVLLNGGTSRNDTSGWVIQPYFGKISEHGKAGFLRLKVSRRGQNSSLNYASQGHREFSRDNGLGHSASPGYVNRIDVKAVLFKQLGVFGEVKSGLRCADRAISHGDPFGLGIHGCGHNEHHEKSKKNFEMLHGTSTDFNADSPTYENSHNIERRFRQRTINV